MNSKLVEYARLLKAWPGLVSRAEAAEPLVSDCLVLLRHIEAHDKVADVGSGGGMPGIPLKIMLPRLDLTLIESDQSKAAFLVATVARLELSGVTVIAERAEIVARSPLRDAFDAVCCRALAGPAVAAELCLPLVRPGGRALLMTSGLAPTGSVARRLGGGEPVRVPAPSGLRERGSVVIVTKLEPTPDRFPRRPGIALKRPLS
ncbi:MAG TPA: 16S rRNA (guanine(527)-N(7))-methyltransferase RsmG [Candidatus Acidoferrales bacterium]|nr:16S rRNA (guanine(527)-N(7))-methyltransferase RsmG [Candidatus Acidoferrales bacterium]